MKIIKFWRIPPRYVVNQHGVKIRVGEIAFSEKHLWSKLDGGMAEIEMPAKPWYVCLWRRFFPLKGIEIEGLHAEQLRVNDQTRAI